MTRHPKQPIVLAAAVWLSFFATSDVIAEDTFFVQKIAPLFQAHCLGCHNDIDKKGDFSLESAESFFRSDVVETGNPGSSHLLDVLTPDRQGKAEMPKGKPALSAADRESIAAWIKQGAVWPKSYAIKEAVISDTNWWSLQPIHHPDVPRLDSDWIRNPIDAFILAKLRTKQLSPSNEADRRTLIRRLYFDLLGLPPSPDAIDRFVADPDPLAYENLAERLLASPQYGERWARHWLDVVKYADTCGYDKDKLRPNAWPYRDYVIRSFNVDKPYTRFVKEQIAGDAFYPNTRDGILGLGFIAAGPWDFIGHVEVPESKIDGRVARHIDRDEMVTNTLNTFCSATIQCARCHNHKFDPFTQQHYYNLQAVFAAVDRAERPYGIDPKIDRRRNQLTRLIAKLQSDIKSINDSITAEGGTELARLDREIAALKPMAAVKDKKPDYGFHSYIVKKRDTVKWVQVDLGVSSELSEIVLRPCHDEFANIGAGFGFPVRFRIEVASKAADFESDKAKVVRDQATDFPNPALVPLRVKLKDVSAQLIRVTATRLAPRSNDFMLALAELQAIDTAGKNVALGKRVAALDSIEQGVRWGRDNLTDGIYPQGSDPQAVEKLAAANKRRQTVLGKLRTPQRKARLAELSKQVAQAKTELARLPKGAMVYAAATSFKTQGNFRPTMGKPRSVKVLHRGNILQPRGDVRPGTIPAISGANSEFDLEKGHAESDRRKALANWITRSDNPLTWRSIVNRVWQYHFGKGIVDSPNDLGRMGRLPTHPKLLDWLASEFRDHGQSIKQLHRLIVTSATYRQTSTHDELKAKIDGSNQFLWRMNRRRLEAEEIRDSVLSVSGRLRYTMGGPGYYLFVLEKTAHSPHYEYHKFDPSHADSHRRSIYRFIVRSQPDPFMTTLDCADSSQSTPQRNETLTSLQALSLLNNRFNLVMAKEFADRLDRHPGDLEKKAEFGFRLVTGRQPRHNELQAISAYGQEHGLKNLARVLFNLSEFVFVD